MIANVKNSILLFIPLNSFIILDYWGNGRKSERRTVQLQLKNDILGMAIICMNGSFVIPIIFAAGSVYFDLDVFRYALNHEPKLLFIIIRFVVMSMINYLVWQILSSMFILMIVFLHPPLRLMSKLAHLSSTNKVYFVKLFRRRSLEAVFRIHSEVYLLCNAASQILYFLLPFLAQPIGLFIALGNLPLRHL
jgi:hypothetical protein